MGKMLALLGTAAVALLLAFVLGCAAGYGAAQHPEGTATCSPAGATHAPAAGATTRAGGRG